MARLLLVDDDPDLLESLTLALEGEHELSTAVDGRAALERLLAPGGEGIQLVVLDLMMPRMSGTELVRELRGRGVDVPVLLTSAAHDVSERAGSVGATGHLRKPYRLSTLRELIRRVVALDREQPLVSAAGRRRVAGG